MLHILLIEDNKEILESIKSYFELEDMQVDAVLRGDDGYERALEHSYDLILLDIMLPGMDGFRIAEKLKAKIETPFLMITAKGDIEDKLIGFDLGAIDYIVKPFDLRELHARIKSIFSRKKMTHVEIADSCFDFEKREFSRGGKSIHLTQKEYLILEILFQNKGKPVTRTDIIEYIWGSEEVFTGDAKLDVYISGLRNKFGKEIIETIKGVGYKV